MENNLFAVSEASNVSEASKANGKFVLSLILYQWGISQLFFDK